MHEFIAHDPMRAIFLELCYIASTLDKLLKVDQKILEEIKVRESLGIVFGSPVRSKDTPNK